MDNGSWNSIAQTNNTYYLDEYVAITPPGGGVGNNFDYKITALINPISESEYSNTVEVNGDLKTKKISGEQVIGDKFSYSLVQNYPNPFNPTTTISYSLKKAGLITLKVYDILGKEVVTLVNENQEAGNYSVKFNASHLPSGIYFYKISSGIYTATKKLILLK
jgi:Secretion system C-terminal sorting domain